MEDKDSTLKITSREVMYEHRVKSFTENGWPYADPTQHSATPENLAMAGLVWNREETAAGGSIGGRCFFCDTLIPIKEFEPETDPWDLHQEKNPACLFIQLGKKRLCSEFNFGEIYNVIVHKMLHYSEKRYCAAQKTLQAMLENAENSVNKFDADQVEK